MSRSRDVSAVQNNLGGAVPPYTAGKNGIINGGFDIWQRGTSIAASSTVTYTADRWASYRPGGGGTVTRQATGDTTNLPNIQYCLRFQRDSGNTSTQILEIAQSFETVNSIPYAGKTVTLSFYARAGANYSAATNILQSYIITGTGTDQNILGAGYTGQVNNSQNNTLTTTWQRFTQTITVPTSATEIGIAYLAFPVGTAGANDYFEITGVQVELGSSATPFSRAGGTIQGELAACQRYYYRAANSGNSFQCFGMGIGEGGTTANINIQLPVPLRVPPTSIEYTTLALLDSATRFTVTSATLITAYTGQLIANVTATVASGLSQYRPYFLQGNNSTSAYVGFSAEL